LLTHFYGYSTKEIEGLTLAQLHDRLLDVVEISNMMKGEGKGRIKRDADEIRRAIEARGLRPPKKL